MNLPMQLRLYLKNSGLTVTELARKTGISRSSLYDWQSGAVTPKDISKIKKLAEAFGTTIDHLLYGNGLHCQRNGSRIEFEEAIKAGTYEVILLKKAKI